MTDIVDVDDLTFALLAVIAEAPLCALANVLRAAYEAHRGKHALADFAVYPPVAPLEAEAHVSRDNVNIMAAPEATDLGTLVALVNDLVLKVPAHGVQAGVHGASVVIRLDPPNCVLYDQMKFWLTEAGDEGHVSPFSDDHCYGELWHTGGDPDPSTWTLTATYDGP